MVATRQQNYSSPGSDDDDKKKNQQQQQQQQQQSSTESQATDSETDPGAETDTDAESPAGDETDTEQKTDDGDSNDQLHPEDQEQYEKKNQQQQQPSSDGDDTKNKKKHGTFTWFRFKVVLVLALIITVSVLATRGGGGGGGGDGDSGNTGEGDGDSGGDGSKDGEGGEDGDKIPASNFENSLFIKEFLNIVRELKALDLNDPYGLDDAVRTEVTGVIESSYEEMKLHRDDFVEELRILGEDEAEVVLIMSHFDDFLANVKTIKENLGPDTEDPIDKLVMKRKITRALQDAASIAEKIELKMPGSSGGGGGGKTRITTLGVALAVFIPAFVSFVGVIIFVNFSGEGEGGGGGRGRGDNQALYPQGGG